MQKENLNQFMRALYSSKNPPSPSLPVEKTSPHKHIFTRRLEKKLKEQFPHENRPIPSIGGSTPSDSVPIAYYQPHNYRLYFDFQKTNFNPKPTPQTDPPLGLKLLDVPYLVEIKNKTELQFMFQNICTITVKQRVVEIINKADSKRFYPIKLDNRIFEQFLDIVEGKDKETALMLSEFIKLFGGFSNYTITNRSSEDKIENEASVAKIPLGMRFRTPIVKKAYNEPNVEFSNPIFAANYLENRALEKVSPEIVDILKDQDKKINSAIDLLVSGAGLLNALAKVATNQQADMIQFSHDIRNHNKAIQQLGSGVRAFNRTIKERQKRLLEF